MLIRQRLHCAVVHRLLQHTVDDLQQVLVALGHAHGHFLLSEKLLHSFQCIRVRHCQRLRRHLVQDGRVRFSSHHSRSAFIGIFKRQRFNAKLFLCVDVSGRALLHSDILSRKVVGRLDIAALRHQQDQSVQCISNGEINLLRALGRSRHTRCNELPLTAFQRFDQQVEVHIQHFQLHAQLIGHQLRQVDVHTGRLAVLAQIFERRKTRGRHHRQHAFFLNLLHNGRPAC